MTISENKFSPDPDPADPDRPGPTPDTESRPNPWFVLTQISNLKNIIVDCKRLRHLSYTKLFDVMV